MRILSLAQFSKEEIKEMSLIEIAYEIMDERKTAISFKELTEEIAKVAGISEEELRSRIAQFYTDLNIDGRFLAIGDNQWGLRVWYPVDQVVEEIVNPVKAKKKKKAKKVVDEDDLDLDDFEEDVFDELDDDDDLLDDDDLDDDLDLDDDDDEDDDDLDDDLDLDDDDDDDDLELDEDFDLDEEEDEELEEDLDLDDDLEK
nr:DNA-directed RNA polymerase subunit delta [Niallia endozanthoxylica]